MMDRLELNTLKNLIESNNSFYNDLKKHKTYKDNYIKVQLIILYFKLNAKFLNNLSSEERKMINNLISYHNFTVSSNYIVYNDQFLSIDYFISLITKIEMQKKYGIPKKEKMIIQIPQTDKEDSETKTHENNIINFNINDKYPRYTMYERESLLENTLKVNKYTIPFINEKNHIFVEMINNFILNYLSNKEEKNLTILKIIYAYLSLYPYLEYATNKIEINVEDLDIPQSEIGILKSTYQEEYIFILRNELETIRKELIKYNKKRKDLESYVDFSSEAIRKIKQKIILIERIYQEKEAKYDRYIHHRSIYNQNLLSFIIKAFEQGNINITGEDSDPLLKIFYIEKDEVKFYCAIHLDTLILLINPAILNNQLYTQKRLQKKREETPVHM